MYLTLTERTMLERTLYNLRRDRYHNHINEPADNPVSIATLTDSELETAINSALSEAQRRVNILKGLLS